MAGSSKQKDAQSVLVGDDLFKVDGNGHGKQSGLQKEALNSDLNRDIQNASGDLNVTHTAQKESLDEVIPDSIYEKKIDLSENALTVLKKRYLKKKNDGKPAENARDLFKRVAQFIASADLLYDENANIHNTAKTFYAMMSRLEFMPNSPTLMNADRDLGQLSACFVLPVEDAMDSIFEAVKHTALIHKSGGGTGFSFSRIRPKNDIVKSTRGIASGPISFMHVFDEATETVKQGGTRRGANMAILRVDHPDILDFIHAKEEDDKLNNFNISVAITENFWAALENDGDYDLINPHRKEVAGQLNAKEVFQTIVQHAWKNGDPGVVFIDRINEFNPTPDLGEIESTNPCGEQPLLPYESCNLGSINLAKMIKPSGNDFEIDYPKLLNTVRNAVHFLDNVIDQNKYPIKEIDDMTRSTRKIGLGVMGFADLLIKLNIPYNSEKAIETARFIMQFIQDSAKRKSQELARERGAFPAFDKSIYAKNNEPLIRNATRTTIAPTGTISIISGCSSGIEPLFALSFTRNVLDNDQLPEIHPLLIEQLKSRGIHTEALQKKIAMNGSLEGIKELPVDMKETFVTSHEVSPDWHIRMQAAFQNFTDNAVSKTVNFPNSATVEDVDTVYKLAHSLGCKGVTIYRDGSREVQVLTKGLKKKEKTAQFEMVNMVVQRPRVLRGCTTKLNTGQGSLYVTINTDNDNKPIEIFANIGKSGGDTAALAEAIGRLISISLQKGVTVEELSQTLIGITGSRPVWNEGILVKSVPDGIGKILLSEFGNDAKVPDEHMAVVKEPEIQQARALGPECPECGAGMEVNEGCSLCRTCGYSHCG
jgi:ribonucleoside-diphosphate reductase alpha chain